MVTDPARVGIAGHSYGGFMTANLLAHSDLFRAGIARSGAYNRTLTPFGFQNEDRTFWEVPEVYSRMSPFFYANKVNEPILLIHGEADNNSGTFPIQSERFYMALKGHGATVRYVTLPAEPHGYQARESILHTVAEMLNWAVMFGAIGAQEGELVPGLHALGNDVEIEPVAHLDDRRDDRGIVAVDGSVDHKRAIDLQRVNRKPLQVTQARIARAEIVDTQLHAEISQLRQQPNRGLHVFAEH